VQTSSNDERDVLVDKFVSSSKQDLQSCSSGETTVKPEKDLDVPAVSDRQDVTAPAKAAPLGLGLGGLERKVRLLVMVLCVRSLNSQLLCYATQIDLFAIMLELGIVFS